MNKKLLAIAVAAAIVAPMVASADSTLYGRLRNSLVYNDPDGGTDQWDIESQSSRLGVKGSEDLGNGLKAIYQIELEMNTSEGGNTSRPFSIDADALDAAADAEAIADATTTDTFGTRLGYVGLTGGFGTFAIGRQYFPYYGSVAKTDVFDVGGMDDTYLGPDRTGDVAAYITPNFSGLSGKLALIVSDDGNDTGEDFLDGWNLSLDYNNGPISVGASYISLEGDADVELWGLAAKYKFGDMFALIAQYEDADDGDFPTAPKVSAEDEWTVMAEGYFGNNTVRASYGSVDLDAGGDQDQWRLGFKHNFSKRTSVHVEYEDSEVGGTDHDRFGLGLRHDF